MNPYGQQGQPGSYGPPPQQPAQPGQYGYYAPPPQPYPAYPPTPSPSGGTAITAAVLAILGSVAQGLGALALFAELGSLSSAEWDQAREFLPGWWRPYVTFSGFLGLAVAVALLVGGILLFLRRDGARKVIATCCVVVIVAAIAELFFALDMKNTLDKEGYSGLFNMGEAAAKALGGTVFPLATLILVLVPASKRWCQARNAGQPSGPAAYPSYG